MQSAAKLFSGTGSEYLAEKIAKGFGKKLGQMQEGEDDNQIYPIDKLC